MAAWLPLIIQILEALAAGLVGAGGVHAAGGNLNATVAAGVGFAAAKLAPSQVVGPKSP